MRIALFSETTLVSHNGVATRLHATLTELAHLGDEAILVVPGVPGLPARYAGARVVGLPSLPLPLYPGLSFGLPWMGVPARRVLTAFQPEIVHALDPISGVGRAALRTAARQQVPLVVSFNTDLPQYTRHYVRGLESLTWAAVRGMHRQADLRLCPSRAVQKRLAVHGIQAHVWTSGVDARRFAPHHRSGAWRRRLTAGGSLAEHTVILLSVGRLTAEKGLPLLLVTLPHVLARTTVPVHVAIVGSGPQEALLRRLARGLPVTFLGPLDGEDLAAAYASADLFVMPSSSETFGHVILEAMASGLATVAAAAGGPLDTVQAGETGLLFDPARLQTLCAALGSLIERSDWRHAMGQRARALIEEGRWSWAAATAGLRQHYTRLCDTPSPRAAFVLPVGRGGGG